MTCIEYVVCRWSQVVPWRFCFCGGWMDLKWCNELYPGCVITINIEFNEGEASASTTFPVPGIPWPRVMPPHPLPVCLPGICKDQCGLATSSRKWWARLWNGGVPKWLEVRTVALPPGRARMSALCSSLAPPPAAVRVSARTLRPAAHCAQAGEAAKFLYGAENFGHFGKATGTMPEWEKKSYSAGSQDHCGLMFPGACPAPLPHTLVLVACRQRTDGWDRPCAPSRVYANACTLSSPSVALTTGSLPAAIDKRANQSMSQPACKTGKRFVWKHAKQNKKKRFQTKRFPARCRCGRHQPPQLQRPALALVHD